MHHIIIVEDENDVREFLMRAFQRSAPNAVISVASNGAIALDMVRSNRCDLLISDQRMPRMTGTELFHALRTEGYTFPCILISADATVEASLRLSEVSAFFYKPLSIRQIRDIITTWLPAAVET